MPPASLHHASKRDGGQLHLGSKSEVCRFLWFDIGASIIRIGFPLRAPVKEVYKGSIIRFYDIGALIIRIGFWAPL